MTSTAKKPMEAPPSSASSLERGRWTWAVLVWRVNLKNLVNVRSAAAVGGLVLGGTSLLAIFILYHSIAAPFAALDRRIHAVAPEAHIIRSRVGSWLPDSAWDAIPATAGKVAISGGLAELSNGDRTTGALVLGGTCTLEDLIGAFGCETIMDELEGAGGTGLFLTSQTAGALGIDTTRYRPLPDTDIAVFDGDVSVGREQPRVTMPGGQTALIVGLLADERVGDLNGGYVAAGELTGVAGLFGHPGQLSAIYATDLTRTDAADLEHSHGQSVEIISPSGQTRYLVPALETLRVFLLVGAVFAGMTGGFLAWATLILSAIERRRTMAMLQAEGAGTAQLVVGFCAEGALLGAVAGLIALPLGVFVGRALVNSYTTSLLAGSGVHLRFEVPVGYLAGIALVLVLLGVVAILPAALSIARQSTAQVLTADVPDEKMAHLTPRGTALLSAVGIAGWMGAVWLMYNAGIGRFPMPVLVASTAVYAMSTIILTVVLAPHLAKKLARLPVLPRRLRLYQMLVEAALTRSPSRTGFTVCVVAMGVSLIFGISTVLTSLQLANTAGIDTLLRDRLIVVGNAVGEPSDTSLDDALVDAISATRGVAGTQRFASVIVDHQILVVAVDNDDPAGAALLTGATLSPVELANALDRGEVVVTELLANRLGVGRGDRLTLLTPKGPRTFPIADVGQFGAVDENGLGQIALVDFDAAEGIWDMAPTALFVTPGSDVEDLDSLARRLPQPGRVRVYDADSYSTTSNSFIGRILHPLLNIGRLALVISIAGVVNMLLLALIARRRERAALSAIGMTTGQEVRLVMGDAMVLGGLGAIFGLGGGIVFAWGITLASPLIATLQPPLHVDPAALALGLGTAFGACVLGALITVLATPRLDAAGTLRMDV